MSLNKDTQHSPQAQPNAYKPIIVLKKNNAVVSFDGEKIKEAIRKSASRVNITLTKQEEDFVVSYVESLCDDASPTSVSKLHDLVECALDSVNPDVAKSYREYRNYKTQFVKMLDQVYRKKLALSSARDDSNANADSELVTTQKAIAYADLNGELYKRFFLTDEERAAQDDGYIYIHDKGARLDCVNCSLFDVRAVLSGGFHMGNVNYREPKTVRIAISLMTDIILNAGSAQYGGFTVSEIDKLLAPYAKTSYDMYFKEWESVANRVSFDEANNYALNKLRKEIEDGAIECEMRLNSATTARGDFVFSSLSFGLSQDPLGQLISSIFLKVRKESSGTADGIPVLFPKLTFLYDEEMHGKGKEQEWLFYEAIACTQRAQYPDFLSMTGDGYAPSVYKQYKIPISRMGCVRGYSEVIYKDEHGDIMTCSLFEMWHRLKSMFKVKSQTELGFTSGEYIDLEGISILDKSGFVPCERIIRNTENPSWYCVGLQDRKRLDCTEDHPWTVVRNGVSMVVPTFGLELGDLVEVFSFLSTSNKEPTQTSFTEKDLKVELAEVVSIKSIMPPYADMTESYDVTTESGHFYCDGIRSHNCRANLSPWYERGGLEPADESDRPVYEGRFNCGVISLNLPMIVMKAKKENADFYALLTYYLDLCRKVHIRTLDYLAHKKAGTNPLAFCEGGFYGGCLKETDEIGRDFLRPCTVSIGITALNEATMLVRNKSLYADKSEWATEVLRFIDAYITKYKKEDGVLYALYGTPAESLASLQVNQFRDKYGIIEGVSSRAYMSNSFHVHVAEDITPIEKLDAEYTCFHLCTGGNIVYNRFGSDHNTEGYAALIREAMKRGYYYGCNLSKNYCCACSAEFLDEDRCPECGSTDLVRIARVCGYVGFERINGESRMNEGKRAEISDRKCM